MKKSRQIPELPEIDWARLAAFVDGEGHISIGRYVSKKSRRTYYKIWISVANTSPALMVWLRRFAVGNFRMQRCSKQRRLPLYDWSVSARTAVNLLIKLRPYFVIKAQEADLAIEFGRPLRLVRSKGGYYLPVSVEEETRRCELIARIRAVRLPASLPITELRGVN